MLASRITIALHDCFNELSRNGLQGFVKKARAFICDPRRKLIRQELKAWPRHNAGKIFRKPPGAGLTPRLVSVIIPIYDRTWELRESIESILCQAGVDFELILVTDGSPAETMDVVESYRHDPRVRIIRFESPSGTAVRGRNAGIAAARGEFIAFQDSDDIAEPSRLAESVARLTESGADVVYGGWKVRLESEREDVGYRDGDTIFPPEFSVADLFRNNRICQSTAMARKAMFTEIGGYKPEMRFREDHELWLRAAYFGYRFVPVSTVMTTLRLNQSNNTLNFLENDHLWYSLMLHEFKNPGPRITQRKDELP